MYVSRIPEIPLPFCPFHLWLRETEMSKETEHMRFNRFQLDADHLVPTSEFWQTARRCDVLGGEYGIMNMYSL
jgi:hypothetical protein